VLDLGVSVPAGRHGPDPRTHYAINEDGSDYDDDVGGPAYVAGRDGVDLEPLDPAQDATARLAAQKLFEQIEQNAR
jgi:hypothetical protein